MPEGPKGLRIYRLAEARADEVWDEVAAWKAFARQTAGRQPVEAAEAIGGNIAESDGRFHYKEDRRFQFYARGSLEETGYWLRPARRRTLIPEERCQEFLAKIGERSPQLNASIRTLDRKAKEGRARL